VAAIIAHNYKAVITQDMIIKAIRSDQFPFIFQVFQMNKNFELIEEESSSDEETSQTEDNFSHR